MNTATVWAAVEWRKPVMVRIGYGPTETNMASIRPALPFWAFQLAVNLPHLSAQPTATLNLKG